MIIESIVIAACVGGKGCDRAANAYVEQNQQLKENIQIVQNKIENFSKQNQLTTNIVSPLYILLLQRNFNIPINNLNLNLDLQNQTINLHWGF
jgi:hypothetical protein